MRGVSVFRPSRNSGMGSARLPIRRSSSSRNLPGSKPRDLAERQIVEFFTVHNIAIRWGVPRNGVPWDAASRIDPCNTSQVEFWKICSRSNPFSSKILSPPPSLKRRIAQRTEADSTASARQMTLRAMSASSMRSLRALACSAASARMRVNPLEKKLREKIGSSSLSSSSISSANERNLGRMSPGKTAPSVPSATTLASGTKPRSTSTINRSSGRNMRRR